MGRLSIWQRYFFGFIILIIIIIPITSFVAVSLFTTGIEQRAEMTINKELDATSRIFYGRLDSLLLYLDSLTYNLCFRDTFVNGEPGKWEALQDIKEHRDLSFAYLIEPDGTILASSDNSSLTGQMVPDGSFMLRFLNKETRKGVVVLDEDFLKAASLGEKATFTIRSGPGNGHVNEIDEIDEVTETKGLGLVASVPFYDEAGNVNAYLLAGDLLNRDEKFVDEISALLKVYATIFMDDLRIATSIRLEDGSRALGTLVSPEVANVVLDEGRRYMGSAPIIGEDYLTAYDPIIDDQGEIIGMLFVGIPEAPFVAMKENTIKQYVYISFLGVFLALIIAYSMSRKITRPLQVMTETMQKVEMGDLSQRFTPQADHPHRTSFLPKLTALSYEVAKRLGSRVGIILGPAGNAQEDEVQKLGSFFNRMMDSLQKNWERNRQLQVNLEEKEIIRVKLLKKMINIQEDERKRIARELHDGTSQSLTSLLLILKTVQQTNDIKSMQKLASTSREVIYNTLEEIQKISYELRPMALDKLGIDEALQRYIGELAKHVDINIHYDNKDCKFCRLGNIIETTVYRIVQEALTNAVRHARPRNIEITLQSDDETVAVIVEDDGIGFDLEYVKCHGKEALGILGMMERASLVGGEIQIDTAPGKGTRILLALPLHEAVVGDYCEVSSNNSMR